MVYTVILDELILNVYWNGSDIVPFLLLQSVSIRERECSRCWVESIRDWIGRPRCSFTTVWPSVIVIYDTLRASGGLFAEASCLAGLAFASAYKIAHRETTR